ncbi:MAG: hypothetical protein JNK60_12890 [Acidobacteria bacterium]|nr:hypothetical protein [Acidobacteriota bacterium]
MSKVLLGFLVGGALGVLDGMTSWFTPEVRPEILQIIAGSTFKGLVAGLLIGLFARRTNNMALTLVFGVIVAGFFAYLVAASMGKFYFEIMLPGAIVGLLTGYATQRYGHGPSPRAA